MIDNLVFIKGLVNFYGKLGVRGKTSDSEKSAGLPEQISDQYSVEKLSDAAIMTLANLQLSESQQETLHELLEKNSEGDLTKLEKKYLDDLMEVYNDALLTKATATRIAVERGLMKPLSSE
ncbi:MAG: hypothetical protein LUM44_21035 [Pyrinomonadaceae bacterium]|nr:hypothetical protein [Pyrinomonadaceae bacterium]